MLAAGADAVAGLPQSVPVLLGSPTWQRSGPLLLQRLQAALQHMAGVQPGQAAWLCQLQARCLLSARHSLPGEMWPALTALL